MASGENGSRLARLEGQYRQNGNLRLVRWLGWAAVIFMAFLATSIHIGGHMMGLTYVSPGNVGLVIDNYRGVVEPRLMPAGTHWQGLWETVIEVPTAQRTISLTNSDIDSHGNKRDDAVQVNTISNMLSVEVSAQYHIQEDRARDLYNAYQDQFADLEQFEHVNLEPAVKGAINFAMGDMDTATALTTYGKQRAEREALAMLNTEWQPRGIVFSNVMVRGVDEDNASKELLATTLAKMQEIDNARLGLQQQQFENTTMLQSAVADARVNRLQNSTLTDLYLQDQILGQVKRIYLPSDEVLGTLK
ncbi:MAG: hypothetical protein LC772_06960 [Chloroflexi bacterium]|nr:hypothetical protein [Chloroflexota bacterium]